MNIKSLKTTCLCLLAVGLFSCQQDDTVPAGDKQITITLAIPGMEEKGDNPTTYAMPADEGRINTVDVLAFKTDPLFPTDPAKGTYLYRATVGHTPGNASFTTILTSHNDNQTLVVLTNCRAEVNTLMGTIAVGDTKASMIQALALTRAAAFDAPTMTGIGMWGEITDQHITAAYNPVGLTVQLTRMLAKINIVNSDVANFTLQEAYLYNPRQKGSVTPDNWNGTNSVTNPTAIIGSALPQGTKFGPVTTSAANRIENKIYTFEADNITKAAADILDATCLVVGGNYQGSAAKYYYRIDLKNYTTDVFFDILRNYAYNITISSVTDEGADTPDDAYRGLSKIEANVEAWNQATSDIQIEGANHLYVSQRYPWLKLDGISEIYPGSKVLKIKSTETTGWTWKNDAVTQATLTAFNVTTTGGAANTEIDVQWAPGNITGIIPGQDGQAIIVSGRIEYIVYFTQDNCGRKGSPLSQKIGMNTYKTHRYGTACWMVENSKEGTAYTTMFNNDPTKVNGYYYNWAQATVLAPNIAAPCPTGWSLPTTGDLYQMKPIANASIYDEGRWWHSAAGVTHGAFAGYSNGPPAMIWVLWNETGRWWIKSINFPTSPHDMRSRNTHGILNPYGTGAYELISVRCIMN